VRSSTAAGGGRGLQSSWRLCGDGRGWLAEVEHVVGYEWGRGKHLAGVAADRLRLPDGD
jgi:hypothetical protein